MTDVKDDRDPPIQEMAFVSGLKVVDIGDYRVARGLTRREFSACSHLRLVYDKQERRIWCKDCERDVEPFDAFMGICENYSRAYDALERKNKELIEAQAFNIRTLAAKAVDEAWRSRSTVPACPHCGHGLFPEHFKTGVCHVGREYALARLKKKEAP